MTSVMRNLILALPLAAVLAACGNDVSVKHYNEPPTVSILSPPNGTTVKEGEPIEFLATADDDTGSNLKKSQVAVITSTTLCSAPFEFTMCYPNTL